MVRSVMISGPTAAAPAPARNARRVMIWLLPARAGTAARTPADDITSICPGCSGKIFSDCLSSEERAVWIHEARDHLLAQPGRHRGAARRRPRGFARRLEFCPPATRRFGAHRGER